MGFVGQELESGVGGVINLVMVMNVGWGCCHLLDLV
jgi:hypothetical protein